MDEHPDDEADPTALDEAVARIAEAHHGHFALHHLRQLSASNAERTHRLESGRWVSPYEQVYRIAGAPTTWRGRLVAACWAGGTRAVASFRSAAALHELPGLNEQAVEITCPRWRRAQHDGLIVHESTELTYDDTTTVDGIPVTTVERTLFDLCAVCRPKTIDLAIDNALRRGLTTFEQLSSTLRRVGRRGRKGTRLFRRLLAERDPGQAPTDSERETMLLHVIRRHRLPAPLAQVAIFDEHGQFVARVDLAYPDMKIAIEYDSYQEHVGKQQLVRDSRRRNALTALGWIVLAATAEDVRYGAGHAFASAIRRARALRLTSTFQLASEESV